MQATTTPAAAATAGTAPTQRFDIYAGIHKALRHRMATMLQRLGSVDTDDDADLQATLDALHALLDTLRGHVRHENDFIHTAIEARRPAAATRVAGEHVEHLVAIADLAEEAQALRDAAPDRRAALALRLYRHFAVFVADNLQHMQLEETSHNGTLWALYTDAELVALHDRLVASIPPAEMGEVLQAMACALAPREISAVLADLRGKLPGEAFVGLWAQLQAAMPGPRAARVEWLLRAALSGPGQPAPAAA